MEASQRLSRGRTSDLKNMMRGLHLCLVLTLGVGQVESSRATESDNVLTADTAMRLLDERGQSVLNEPEFEKHWDTLLRGIASGSPQWTEVGIAILGMNNVEAAETVESAFGEALRRAAPRILGEIEKGRLSVRVCGNTFGAIGILGADETEARQSLLAQRFAVAQLTQRNLATMKSECLAQIDAAIAIMK